MRIEADTKLDFKDVLIRPKRSTLNSRYEVDLEKTYRYKISGREWTGVPIIASNMDTIGTFEIAKALAGYRMLTAIHKYITVQEWEAFFENGKNKNLEESIFISTGILDTDIKRLNSVLDICPLKNICVDVANGYSENFVDCVRRIREKYPSHTIMAGNVVTGEMTEELIISGADIVKVGIGPGSVCVTRKITGVGYPQLSAIVECGDAAHGLNGHIAADGGCVCPGDIAKAFGGGADFVMLGGMFAGHDEAAGNLIEVDGKQFKTFYGMSSKTAMMKYSGGVASYRACEGKTVTVPYRGPVSNTVQEILGGLRSACTYVGAKKLKELPKRTTFIRVTQQINQVFNTNSENSP